MFISSTQFGVCPYDGFWIHSDQAPKASFVAALKPKDARSPGRSPAVWRHFVNLTIADAPGALKVMWEPTTPYAGAPQTRIYFNPSVTGYSARETLNRLSSIIDQPLKAKLVQLDTKVDVAGTYWSVAAHIYMPYVRYRNNHDFPGTVYEGKLTKLTIYQKSGWRDDFPELLSSSDDEDVDPPPTITRIEVRQRFKKKRPLFGDFLRGNLVPDNLLGRPRVLEDLDQLGDRVLAEEALKLGLTRAVREYPVFSHITRAELMATKRLLNRISTSELYGLYLVQANHWHASC